MRILWLDDIRDPGAHGYAGATWVKSYEEAICALNSGVFDFASLDHDLGVASTIGLRERTGYDVLCYIEEHELWPLHGVSVHSSNPSGKEKMLAGIRRHYGRTF